MLFGETRIPGVHIIELERYSDDRGFFARGWCRREFGDQDLNNHLAQMNISFNRHKHPLRGFHYQVAPYQEDKLLRCIRGSVYDVLLDLRPESSTYMQRITIELSASNYLTSFSSRKVAPTPF